MRLDFSVSLLPDSSAAHHLEGAWSDLCVWIAVAPEERHDPEAIARQIAAHAGAAELTRAIAAAFTRVADSLGRDPSADVLAKVIADAMVVMRADALDSVVSAMTVPQRKVFIDGIAAVFPPRTLLAATIAAASSYGVTISPPLVALLEKLCAQADGSVPSHSGPAEQAFRSLVTHLSDGWASSEAEATPDAIAPERPRTRVTPQPVHVVQFALETGAMGHVVRRAIDEHSRSEADVRDLFRLLKRAAAGSAAAETIAHDLGTPARLVALLKEEPADFEVIDFLVARMGPSAVRPLLDELTEARLRETRRGILDLLVQLGPVITPFVNERISDRRWYVVRNMATLLRETRCPLDHVPVDDMMSHADPRVRREALQLLLEHPARRDAALTHALQDADRQVLKVALQAARTGLPARVVPLLAHRVMTAEFPAEFRVLTLLLLGRCTDAVALDVLLAFVSPGNTLFGKPKLAVKSPEMLAALGGLARTWPVERRSAALLAVARSSKDEQIRNAVQGAAAGHDSI